MAELRRWIVTYTKHLTQKRKVYQDGFLEFSSSRNKMILYDDNRKMVDSRFLKKDEIIQSGGTLTLEAHIVDIGCPEGETDALSGLNVCRRDMRLNDEVKAKEQKGNKKGLLHSGFPQNRLDDVKGEIKDSRMGPGEVVTPSSVSGKLANNTKVLGNKRLRNGDIFKRSKLQAAVNTCLRDSCVPNKRALASNEPSCSEWCVLYTSQMTKKVKSYHDGILRLSACGSYMNQAILLSEDGIVLCSKHIKSVESWRTGNRLDFPNYLVEIGESRPNDKSVIPSHGSSSVVPENIKAQQSSSSSTGKCVSLEKNLKPLPYVNLQSEKVEDFKNCTFDKSRSHEKLVSTKPLRNACQIMSILNRSWPQETTPQALPTEQIQMSQEYNHSEAEPGELDMRISSPTRGSGDSYVELKVSQHPSSAVAIEQEVDLQKYCQFTSNPEYGNVMPNNTKMGLSGGNYDPAILDAGPKVSDTNMTNDSANILSENGLSQKELIHVMSGLRPLKDPSLSSHNILLFDESSCTHQKENVCNDSNSGIWGKSNKIEDSMSNEDTDQAFEKFIPQGLSTVRDCAASDAYQVPELQESPNRCQSLNDFPTFDLGF